MNEGDVLPSVERTITQDRIAKYAAASGDFNPIHVDEAFAADSRFGGTIAHGMLVAASVSEVMSAVFGLDWLDDGRLKLRFRAPVFPGDTITAYGVVKAVGGGEGPGEVVCSVGVRRQTGEDAITGEASVRVRR